MTGKITALDLISKAIEINADDFRIFTHFFGHTQSIQVDIHLGGWREGNGPDHKIQTYIDADYGGYKTVSDAYDALVSIYNKFKNKEAIL